MDISASKSFVRSQPLPKLDSHREPWHLTGILALALAGASASLSYMVLDHQGPESFMILLHYIATPVVVIVMGMYDKWKDRIPWALLYTSGCLTMMSLTYLTDKTWNTPLS